MDKLYVRSGSVKKVIMAESGFEAAKLAIGYFFDNYKIGSELSLLTMVDSQGFCEEEDIRETSMFFSTRTIIEDMFEPEDVEDACSFVTVNDSAEEFIEEDGEVEEM